MASASGETQISSPLGTTLLPTTGYAGKPINIDETL
jgi:hypothetical protein